MENRKIIRKMNKKAFFDGYFLGLFAPVFFILAITGADRFVRNRRPVSKLSLQYNANQNIVLAWSRVGKNVKKGIEQYGEEVRRKI